MVLGVNDTLLSKHQLQKQPNKYLYLDNMFGRDRPNKFYEESFCKSFGDSGLGLGTHKMETCDQSDHGRTMTLLENWSHQSTKISQPDEYRTAVNDNFNDNADEEEKVGHAKSWLGKLS